MRSLSDAVGSDRQALHWMIVLQEHPDDEKLRERFELWRLQSAEHEAAWQELAGVDALIAAAERHAALRKPRFHPVSWRPGAISALALAACLLLALLPVVQRYWQADALTAVAEIKTLNLVDGSQVTLAPDSAISVTISDTQRQVRLLRGEAFFQVSRDPGRPFTATAGDSSARVLGTAFNVRRLADSAEISVAEGSVLVSRGSHSHRLVAGQWIDTANLDLSAHEIMPADLVGPWRHGQLVVKDRSLSEVVAILRRYHPGMILVHGEMADRRVTGIYDLTHPEDILAALVAPLGGRIVRVAPWLTLVFS